MKQSLTFALIGGVILLVLLFMDIIGFGYLILGMFILMVVSAFMSSAEHSEEIKKKQDSTSEEIKTIENGSFQIKLITNRFAFALNKNKDKFAIKANLGKYDKFKVYLISDIESISVYENSTESIKIVKENGLKRAVIGGVLFGGVGAIVGAVTAKEKEVNLGKKYSNIYLEITLTNFKIKVTVLDAWEDSNRTKKELDINSYSGEIIKKALKDAYYVQSSLNSLIKENE